METGKVIVRGPDVRRPPLFEGTGASAIEIYDRAGELIAFMVQVFNDDTWGLCTKADPDWLDMCVRFGHKGVAGATPEQLIRQGVKPFVVN